MPNGVFLKFVRLIEQGKSVRNDDDHLALAMWTETLLAGVLVFDLERVPVRALDLNSHAGPASPKTAQRRDEPRRDWNVELAGAGCMSALALASCRRAYRSVRASGSAPQQANAG